MANWTTLNFIGNACRGKYFKFRRPIRRVNLSGLLVDSKLPGIVALPAGSIGFCYSANSGTIFLGFGKDFMTKPSGLQSPTAYHATIVANVGDIDSLDIEL